MDDDTRQYLDKMEERLTARIDIIADRMETMVGEINAQTERVLDALSEIRRDHDTTRGHVLYGLQDSLTLSQRISRLEDEMRKR